MPTISGIEITRSDDLAVHPMEILDRNRQYFRTVFRVVDLDECGRSHFNLALELVVVATSTTKNLERYYLHEISRKTQQGIILHGDLA